MKFELSLAILLALLTPGLVILGGVIYFYGDLTSTMNADLSVTQGFFAVIFTLAVGGLINTIRALVLQPINKVLAKKLLDVQLDGTYISRINKENFEIFLMLVDRSYEYHRLNSNVGMAVICILPMFLHNFFSVFSFIAAVLVSLIVLIISTLSYSEMAKTFNAFK